MNFYLCGFQGVGKTFFGQALAAQLQRPFFDVDHCLLEASGATCIRDLCTQIGESCFREREVAVVEQLGRQKGSVVALGGGSLTHPRAQAVVQRGRLVYLYKPYAVLQTELEKRELPTYLSSYAAFESLFIERHATFCRLAHAIVKIEESARHVQ